MKIKSGTNEPIRVVAAKGRGEGEGQRGSLELIDANVLHLGWINSNVLMYSTGNYLEYPMINYNRKEC